MKNRIRLVVGRCVLDALDDTQEFQELKISILSDEIKEQVERFQNYGFTGNPKAGAEGVVMFPGGNRDHPIVICVDDRRFRLVGLEDGEVAMYTDEGDKIHFKRGNVIEITAAEDVNIITKNCTLTIDETCRINAALLELLSSGDTLLDGLAIKIGEAAADAIVKGDAFKTYFDTHQHTTTAAGSPTSPPITPMPPATLSTLTKVE